MGSRLRWSFLVIVAIGATIVVAVHLGRLPTGARGYYNRGVADNHAGRLDSALANFEKALELEPQRTDAYVARAMTWMRMGKPYRALVDADAAMRISPGSSRAVYVRGIAERSIGREDQAMADFAQAMQLDAGFARAELSRAGVLLDAGSYPEALAAARAAWAVRAEDPAASYAPFIVWAARTLGGDAAGADAEFGRLLRGGEAPGVEAWREGVRRYAAGDAAGALDRFREAAGTAIAETWVKERAWSAAENIVLGFRVELVNREISESMSFGSGLRVTCVRAGSGLVVEDRLVRIDGQDATEDLLVRLVQTAAPGTPIPWEGLRGGVAISGEITPASSAPTR